jgi:HSP20 family protein
MPALPEKWVHPQRIQPMAAIRTTPFDLFEKLEQQLSQAERVPAAEVRETETGFSISLELPGVDRASINVKATERTLVVTAERPAPEAVPPLLGEFRYGTWSRSFRFPRGIQRDALKAQYRDGILLVTATKAEAADTVTVAVEA